MATIDPTAYESVGFNNIKVVGEGPAFWTNLAMSNAVADQQAKRTMENVVLSMWAKSFVESDPIESIAVKQMLTGDTVGEKVINLASSLAYAIGGMRTGGVAPGPVANTVQG